MDIEHPETNPAVAALPAYVWHLGKVWKNPKHPLDHGGRISLECINIFKPGSGILAPLSQVYPCDAKVIEAIHDAQKAGQLLG